MILKIIKTSFNFFSISIKLIFWSIIRAYEEHIEESAACMAFFTFLSFFSFVLIVIAVSSFVLKNENAQIKFIQIIINYRPLFSKEMISQNIYKIIEIRTTVGILGGITLLWTGTSIFSSLVHNLNRAWIEAPGGKFF